MQHFPVIVSDTVRRARTEVFEAIVNPDQLAGYFVSRSSGPLEADTTVDWTWDEYDKTLSVQVEQVEKDALIVFRWAGSGVPTKVNIELSDDGNGHTQIEIRESAFAPEPEGIRRALEQTQGWTHFICCLQAWLYTGVNLRNGQQTRSKA